MKTRIFISVLGLFIAFNSANCFAGESKKVDTPADYLQGQIAKLFDDFSDEINPLPGKQGKVTLKFLVNEKKEIVNVRCDSENEELQHYVQKRISNAKFSLPGNLQSKFYRVAISFTY